MAKTTAIQKRASTGTKHIEKLAAALEKASSVDEIKDVRDRAMAIQLYTRKKKGGLQAAQAAGRVVTNATLMLAKLYAEEESAQSKGRPKKSPDSSPDLRPGKEAIAKAADLDGSQLRRLAPIVEASAKQIAKAEAAIEARGDVVTPNALLREIAPAVKEIIDRSPQDFKSATDAIGVLRETSEFAAKTNVAAIIRGSTPREQGILVDHAMKIHEWTAAIIEEAGNGQAS